MANYPSRENDSGFARFLESLGQPLIPPFVPPPPPPRSGKSCSFADLWRVTVLASEDLVPRYAPLVVWRRLPARDMRRVNRDMAVLLADVASGETLWASLQRLLARREADKTALSDVRDSLMQATRDIERLRRERR